MIGRTHVANTGGGETKYKFAMKEVLTRHRILLLPWPSCSPDLNTIDYTWDVVGKAVMERSPLNVRQLEQFVLYELGPCESAYLHGLCTFYAKSLTKANKVFLVLVNMAASLNNVSWPNESDACTNYTIMDGSSRQYNNTLDENLCDNSIANGWYKFTINGIPAEIPSACISNNHCGTQLPLRLDMSGEEMPGINTTVYAHVCSSYAVLGKWDCCVLRQPVGVRNCGEYYVYYLNPTDRCPVAYCAQSTDVNPHNVVTIKPGENVTPADDTQKTISTIPPSADEDRRETTILPLTDAIQETTITPSDDHQETTIVPSTDDTTVLPLAENDVTSSSAAQTITTTSTEIDLCTSHFRIGPFWQCKVDMRCYNSSIDNRVREICGWLPCEQICDSAPECDDGSDEDQSLCAAINRSCQEGQVLCVDLSNCATQCNGIIDCADGSDENNCPTPGMNTSDVTNTVPFEVTTQMLKTTEGPLNVTSLEATTSSADSVTIVPVIMTTAIPSMSTDDTPTQETTIGTESLTSQRNTNDSVSHTAGTSSGTTESISRIATNTITTLGHTENTTATTNTTDEATVTGDTISNLENASTETAEMNLNATITPTGITTDNGSRTESSQAETDSVSTILQSELTTQSNINTSPEQTIISNVTTDQTSSSEEDATSMSSIEPETSIATTVSSVTNATEDTSSEESTTQLSQITISYVPSHQTTLDAMTTKTQDETTSVDINNQGITTSDNTQQVTTRVDEVVGTSRTSTLEGDTTEQTTIATTMQTALSSSPMVTTNQDPEIEITTDAINTQSTIEAIQTTQLAMTTTLPLGTTSDVHETEEATDATAQQTSVAAVPSQTSRSPTPTAIATSSTASTIKDTTTETASTQVTLVDLATTQTQTTQLMTETSSITQSTVGVSITHTSQTIPGTPIRISPTSSTLTTYSADDSQISTEVTTDAYGNLTTSTNATVEVVEGDYDYFKQHLGMFIFFIVSGTVMLGIMIFGIVGFIYTRRLRSWDPNMVFQDAYADMEKENLSVGEERKFGENNPIPDVDILRCEQGAEQETSLSRASTIVCQPRTPPTQIAMVTPIHSNNDHSVIDVDTADDKLMSMSQPSNGVMNEGFLGDEGGIVPVDELDTRVPRIMFPWIENAEDTKL